VGQFLGGDQPQLCAITLGSNDVSIKFTRFSNHGGVKEETNLCYIQIDFTNTVLLRTVAKFLKIVPSTIVQILWPYCSGKSSTEQDI
jgi:hypothetical protein